MIQCLYTLITRSPRRRPKDGTRVLNLLWLSQTRMIRPSTQSAVSADVDIEAYF